MPTIVVSPVAPDADALAQAAAILRAGGLVAFPTETVYGLGAHALDPAAVARIYAAKGRPGYNPLIVHVADAHAARELAAGWPDAADRLARRFWPGPLTIVLPKRPHVPDAVTAGLPSVAVRVPAHPVAMALLRACGLPVAAPSANRFTELSPVTARHVERALGDRVDLVLDGGPCDVGIESTVVSLAGGRPVLLRPGVIAAEAIEAVVGPLARAAAVHGDAPREAPGMVDRHYAPRARLRLFDAGARGWAAALVRASRDAGERTGALLLGPLDAPVDRVVAMPGDPGGYAARLYAALHELDDAECALVVAERVPAGGAWDGVRDRLERAAR